MACWSLILLYERLSSAKSLALECWAASGKLLICTKTRKRPRTVPQGTPDRTAAEDDSVLSSATHWFSASKEGRHPVQGLIAYSIVL